MWTSLMGSLPLLKSGRSVSVNWENRTGAKGAACQASSALGKSRKGSPCIPSIAAGETVTLAELTGSGAIQHIWCTVTDATPKGRFVLRDLVLRMYWDGEETPSVECPLGGAVLSLYPPVGEGDLNEQGLTALCSAGDFDVLITGDMAGSTERKLVGQYDLPDIEVLVVGHHGSRYSSTDAFLQQVRPETAIISVGDNSYGHPTQEAMDRLSRNGAAVYRTDRQGGITVYAQSGEET